MGRKNKALKYRKMAAECRAVASRMSLRADRERMKAMEKRWIALAEKIENAVAEQDNSKK